MHDPRTRILVADALAGRISRRQTLSLGLRLGLASPVITALLAVTPGISRASSSPRNTSVRLSAAQEGSGVFNVVIQAGYSDLDPQYAYDNLSSMFFLATYEMLLQLKASSTDEFEPMLAESWEVSEDQSTYTFKLAPNATFHDGTPCDAEAVKGSFTRFLLQGGGPVNVISRFVQDPEQMEVVDATTIRFNLGRSQPLFLAAMASEYGPFIVNPAAVEANKTEEDPFAHQWLQDNTAGGGPYQVTEYVPNDRVVLERFADYHKGRDGGQFDQIFIRVVPENATRRQLIENGDADAITFSLTPDDVAALQGNPDLQVLAYDTTNVQWVTMNAPRLMTREVRQGFSYAFPYDQVVDGAYKGLLTRTSGPIPTTVRGYDPEGFIYQTDLAKARELVLSGGFVEGDSFEYMFESGDEIETVIAQLFQANVAEMGFQLELTELDGATLNQLEYGDLPAEERPHFFGGWSWWPDYNDPWNQLAPNFLEASTGEGGANAGYWVNERFEEIMAEAETYTDEDQLVALMKEAQNILTEQDPPGIYYGQLKWYTILRKDIQGYHHNPLYLGSYPFYEMSRTSAG
jgi:peptide/nickel transport system substrate-binding protein